MIEQRPYVRRKSLDNSYQILGHVFSFLAEEKDTGGLFTLIEVNPFPGTEPPPHIRRQDDEGFYVLQGELEHQIDGETVVARPGDFVLAPQGALRSFRFRSPEARLLLLLAPGGAEEGLREIGRPAPSLIPQFPEGGLPSPEAMQAAFAAHGVEFGMPPAPGTPMPQLILNEALARRAGVGRSVWSRDQLVTVLAGSRDTHGRFSLIETVVGRGRELPPHTHREDVAYVVLTGEATVLAAGEPLPASAGSLVFVPKRTEHSLRVHTEEARLLTLASPAGLEEWFQAAATPALEMTLPPAGAGLAAARPDLEFTAR